MKVLIMGIFMFSIFASQPVSAKEKKQITSSSKVQKLSLSSDRFTSPLEGIARDSSGQGGEMGFCSECQATCAPAGVKRCNGKKQKCVCK